MATDLKHSPDVSVTELISGLIGDVQVLVKQQFELLKHDTLSDLAKMRDAGLLTGAGAVFGMVAAILVMQMLVYLTQWLLPEWPLWACFALWAGLAVVISGGLIAAGINRFKAVRPLEEPAAMALKENVEWISHPK